MRDEKSIKYEYNQQLKYGMIILNENINIGKETFLKNKDLYFYCPEHAYYLNEDKTKLYIIIELVGQVCQLDVKSQLNRGIYIFIVEGTQIKDENDSKNNRQFLIRIQLSKFKYNIREIKRDSKKIYNSNGIYTIEYDIEQNSKRNFI